MCELTIFEVTKENKNRFHPIRYWISLSLSEQESKVASLIERIQPGLQRTKQFGNQSTLHIGNVRDVLSHYNDDTYYITIQALSDLAQKYHYRHFQISHLSRKCISLCFRGLSIGASLSFTKDEIINIENKVTLLGGTFVSIKDSREIDVYITDLPIISSKMCLFSDGFKIVNLNWLIDSFSRLSCMDYSEYSVGCFNSLRISSSDLDPSFHRQLKAAVVNGKGIWCENLDKSVDFLLASHLSSTQKVKIAMEMSTPIINPQWIYLQSKQPTPIEPFVLNFWCLQNFTPSALFSNLSFAIHIDCENRNSVIEAITAHSGRFTQDPDYVIVPPFYQSTKNSKFVTVSWIWECITQKQLIDRHSSIAFHPLPYQKPSSALKNYVVVLYHFRDSLTRYSISECLRALGVCVHYKISKMSSIVVYEKEDSDLVKNIHKFSLQAVPVQWILKLIQTGEIPPIKSYVPRNEKDLAIQSIRKGLKKQPSDIEKSRPSNKEDCVLPFDDKLSKLFSDEFQLTQFSDTEDVAPTSPTIRITYESPITKHSKKRNDSADDPLLSLVSTL